MSALRERPRVVAAQVLGVIALLAIGFVLGGAVKGDPEPKTPADVQQRLDRLESQNTRLEGLLRAQNRRADKAEAATKRQARGYQRRLRRAAVRERRFRAALRRARAN
jgi:hypothetical protein